MRFPERDDLPGRYWQSLLALVDEIGLIPWQVDGAGGFGSGVAYISRRIRAGVLQIMSTPDAILRLVGEHGIYSDLIKKTAPRISPDTRWVMAYI